MFSAKFGRGNIPEGSLEEVRWSTGTRQDWNVFHTKPPPRIEYSIIAQGSGGTIRLTHEQLAELVGTTRETVTKVLGELVVRGLVQLRRGKIVVTKPRELQDLAATGGLTLATGGHRR